MNNDLISRSALIAEFERIYETHYKCTVYQFINDIFKAMFRRLENAPAVDAVEVVRCKDCTHMEDAYVCNGFLICPASNMEITDNDSCSYGERRTDERD